MTIILFIIVLAILILSHELGHFLVAKISGIRVDEFAFGFPPRLFSFKKGETRYSFNALPLGGYVKIHGEEGDEENDPRSFASKKIYIRAAVIFAGVFFNLVLAWILLSGTFMLGMPTSVEDFPEGTVKDAYVTVIEVQKGTPAEKAGLRVGDQLLDFNTTKDLQKFINENKGKEINLKYKRGKEANSILITPSENPEQDKGALGIAMDKIGLLKLPWYKSIWEGLKRTIGLTALVAKLIFEFIADAFNGEPIIDKISGPVGIFKATGNFATLGFTYILGFIALFSINLAVINILPFPALDGGRILFLLIELIKGSPVNHRFSNMVHTIGLVLLLVLLAFITYHDILKFI